MLFLESHCNSGDLIPGHASRLTAVRHARMALFDNVVENIKFQCLACQKVFLALIELTDLTL